MPLSGGELVVVDRVGGVLAAVWVGPGAVAVAGHGQGPAGTVFDPVVVFAEGDKVPYGGGSAAGERDDVVGFAPRGVDDLLGAVDLGGEIPARDATDSRNAYPQGKPLQHRLIHILQHMIRPVRESFT